jgi:hypothetical protein
MAHSSVLASCRSNSRIRKFLTSQTLTDRSVFHINTSSDILCNTEGLIQASEKKGLGKDRKCEGEAGERHRTEDTEGLRARVRV